ncbi:hypothetical protein L596_011979 [Steinernema carpocapsae]|uniref:Uncharacterized protein n=1 Tax=Steinernema carpocapsae TaxID=34508 RepID=A0A4U5NVX2_STECR|nr:hypothetical protein L596_011979 [Steinernema carpocapsae]
MFLVIPLFAVVSLALAAENSTEALPLDNSTTECKISNLRKVMKKTEFSVFGLYSNCTIFHLTSEVVDGGNVDLSDSRTDQERKCKMRQLDVTSVSGVFRLLVLNNGMFYTQLMCPLLQKRENDKLTCVADISESLRSTFKAPGFSDLIQFKAAADRNVGYQLGVDMDMNPKFIAVNFENNTYTNVTVTAPEKAGQISALAYDSDNEIFYYKDTAIRSVALRDGKIDFSKTEDVTSIKDVDKIRSMSVSKEYVILKQDDGSAGYKYYIQHILLGNKECFAETKGNNMDLKLLVSPGINDVIHNLIFPTTTSTTTTTQKPESTKTPDAASTEMLSAALFLFSSLFLFAGF